MNSIKCSNYNLCRTIVNMELQAQGKATIGKVKFKRILEEGYKNNEQAEYSNVINGVMAATNNGENLTLATNLQELRINYAAELIISSNMTYSDITYLVNVYLSMMGKSYNISTTRIRAIRDRSGCLSLELFTAICSVCGGNLKEFNKLALTSFSVKMI